MIINVRERNGVTIFDIQGNITASDAANIHNRLVATRSKKILLDLRLCDNVDGDLLVHVIAVNRYNTTKVIKMMPSINTRQMIVMAGLADDFVSIFYDNEDEAIASFQL